MVVVNASEVCNLDGVFNEFREVIACGRSCCGSLKPSQFRRCGYELGVHSSECGIGVLK